MKNITDFMPYIIGLLLSLILTLAGYLIASMHVEADHAFISHNAMIPLILILAFLQLIVQLFFFLHLGKKDSVARINLTFFVLTTFGIFAIVVGSIWIMTHLNYNHLTPHETEQHIYKKEGIH